MRALTIAIVTTLAITGVSSGPAAGGGGGRNRTIKVLSGELVSKNIGWAETENCHRRDGRKVCARHLYVTNDMGSTWRDASPRLLHDMYAFDVFFLNRRRGWMTLSDCGLAKAFILRTIDGGRSWRSEKTGWPGCHAGDGLTVGFLDRRHGYMTRFSVVAEGDTSIYKTSDGGKTWSDPRKSNKGGEARFVTRRIGHLSGSFGQRFYRSANGGRRWHERPVARPDGYAHAPRNYALPTFVGDVGVLPVTLREKKKDLAFYRSFDKGESWSLPRVLQTRVGASGDSLPTAIVTRNIWWAFVGRPARAYVTTDGGVSWTQSSTGLDRASSISAIDERTAWATTYDRETGKKFLYATRDGGASWTRLRPRL